MSAAGAIAAVVAVAAIIIAIYTLTQVDIKGE